MGAFVKGIRMSNQDMAALKAKAEGLEVEVRDAKRAMQQLLTRHKGMFHLEDLPNLAPVKKLADLVKVRELEQDQLVKKHNDECEAHRATKARAEDQIKKLIARVEESEDTFKARGEAMAKAVQNERAAMDETLKARDAAIAALTEQLAQAQACAEEQGKAK